MILMQDSFVPVGLRRMRIDPGVTSIAYGHLEKLP